MKIPVELVKGQNDNIKDSIQLVTRSQNPHADENLICRLTRKNVLIKEEHFLCKTREIFSQSSMLKESKCLRISHGRDSNLNCPES